MVKTYFRGSRESKPNSWIPAAKIQTMHERGEDSNISKQVPRTILLGPPGVLGIWGEWLFIFRELGRTGNYFRGAREQAHNFGDIGSLAKKQKIIRKSLHFV